MNKLNFLTLILTTTLTLSFSIPTLANENVCSPINENVCSEQFSPINGLWDSSYGNINFHQEKDEITGSYEENRSQIYGTLSDHLLTGIWVEPDSAITCDTMKNNSYHWGQLEFMFNESFTHFEGKWGYCDHHPLNINWDGDRME
jgi:hypothetical protein